MREDPAAAWRDCRPAKPSGLMPSSTETVSFGYRENTNENSYMKDRFIFKMICIVEKLVREMCETRDPQRGVIRRANICMGPE
jgi:hypothetical protein